MLCGTRVTLFPLSQTHAAGLRLARMAPAHIPPGCRVPPAHDLGGEISYLLEQQADGHALFFAVSDSAERPIGITGFSRINRAHKQLEIGGTWIQDTDPLLFTEMTTMQLTYAFECAQAVTVQMRAPAQDAAYRAILFGLGARLDGVLRCDKIDRSGTPINMAVYSIIASEWPKARSKLLAKLL
jgi:RimJ/RimL family protein N-acetyltransferase